MTVLLYDPGAGKIESFRGDWSILSNFATCTPPIPVWFTLAGGLFLEDPADQLAIRIDVPTSEHVFQACKAHGSRDAMIRILRAPSARDAKYAGTAARVHGGISAWEERRIGVMAHVVTAKFRDPARRARLLATGDAHLIEGNTWGDSFWGVCSGIGHNHLGRILMFERAAIRRGEREDVPACALPPSAPAPDPGPDPSGFAGFVTVHDSGDR